MGQDYQHMGMSLSHLLYLVGKPQLSKKLQTGLQELKLTKIKDSIQRTPLLNIWAQQDTNAHPCCLHWITFPVSTQKSCKTATCMQVALEAFARSELYGTSIIMHVASDSTWLVWIERDRDNLN